jgi:hypothetical protein
MSTTDADRVGPAHTQGEWRADVDSTFASQEEAVAWFARVYAAGASLEASGVVAVCEDDGVTEVLALTGNGMRSKANARLMAAAPDLLTACQALLDARYSSWHRFAEEDEREPFDMFLARAAIAKAEGR